MAKRRTRAQKQRAAERRATSPMAIKTSSKITELAKTDSQKAEITTTSHLSLRQLDLRTSLLLLGGLLAMQVVLWLIFRLTQLDENLYNWIKI